MGRWSGALAAVALGLAGAGAAVGVSACGGDKPHLTAAERQGTAAVERRRIPQGITLSYTQTGPAWRNPEDRAIATVGQAKYQCGNWHSRFVTFTYAKTLIGHATPADLDRAAHGFAVARAAPGHLADVERGCRQGLDDPAGGAPQR
jgi:hypothetical protein